MIRAVLINNSSNDEDVIILKECHAISLVGEFKDCALNLQTIIKLNLDIAFIGLDKSTKKAIDLAIKIIESYEDIKIVFLSKERKHALSAFEMGTFDYLLKPITEKRLNKTIERVTRNGTISDISICNRRLIVKTFGGFRIFWEENDPFRWRTEKVKELFAFLLQNADTEISKDTIIQNIFKNQSEQSGSQQLYNCIHYIRKTFRDYGVDRNLLIIKDKYMLKVGDVDIDRKEYIEISLNSESVKNIRAYERKADLYRGSYLEGMQWAWAEKERQVLKDDCVKTMLALANYYLTNDRLSEAEDVIVKLIRTDPDGQEIGTLVYNLSMKSRNIRGSLLSTMLNR